PQKLVTGKPVNFTAKLAVDIGAERLQAFQEAWKSIKDAFYDPKLHGVNWEAVKKRYEPVVKSVRTTEELNSLIERMLGELKASHMGVWGGPYPKVRNATASTGYLGWILVPDAKGKFRVDQVLAGGPADKVWIRKGDYVFEVAGKRLTKATNLARVLNGKAGRAVPVRVGPTPSRDDSRVIPITPLDWRRIRGVQYKNWLDKRKGMVKKAGRKLGYIHLRGMGSRDLDQFKKAISGRLAKTDGLLLDVRNNGGGNIHQELLDILTRKPFGAYHPRGGKKTYQPALYYTKPVVVLINERSFSDAEVFPYGFKALKRGTVVGVPTNGGVIGTGATTLINGATLRLPRVGWYTLEGENLEGLGVKPDILVEETPEDRRLDRDPQLTRAIRVLKSEIVKAKAEERKGKKEEKIEPAGKTHAEEEEEEGF
ncbi:MAG: S41 family peptidase, partial [Planctomycetota bacterium]